MREILFRGMHSHMFSCNEHLDGTWVYGYLVDENYINDKRDLGDGEYLGEMLIDPETVGQFTGLRDKNGTKIFEGDIVNAGSRKYAVEWVEGYLCGWMLCNDVTLFDTSFEKNAQKNYEVIGNIHENPELLED